MVKHYENLYPGAVENKPVPTTDIQRETLPKVAEEPVFPGKTQKEKEISSKNVIDNWEKSTYSVLNKRQEQLSETEAAVFALLGDTPQLPDSIMDRADLPASTVQSILTRLTIKGVVNQHPDGRISRK